MNKKGSAGLAIVAVILALIILTVYLVNIAQRECNNNQDCGDDSYCGSDYECHQFPKQTLVKQNDFLPAAIVFGVSLIIAAKVFRKGK